MKLDWNDILSTGVGGFWLVIGNEDFVDASSEKNIDQFSSRNVLRVIRGQRCKTRENLFQEFAAALQFPARFGFGNWSSFDDCIRSLSTHENLRKMNSYTFLITNFDEVFVESTNNGEQINNILLYLLKHLIGTWKEFNKPIIPLYIVIHCEKENEQKCKELLAQENIKYAERIGPQYYEIT
jgi:hypothetical protein